MSETEEKKTGLWTLFLTFAKVGVMTFGGGLAMLPILEREVVTNRGWATSEQMLDYFRTSGFQVFFAAPDDALSKIGKYMDSIITCFKPAGKMYSQYIDGFRV